MRLGTEGNLVTVSREAVYNNADFIEKNDVGDGAWLNAMPVSYTHLDVYKRQIMRRISKKDKMNKRKRALLFGLEGSQATVMEQRKEFIQEYLTRGKVQFTRDYTG